MLLCNPMFASQVIPSCSFMNLNVNKASAPRWYRTLATLHWNCAFTGCHWLSPLSPSSSCRHTTLARCSCRFALLAQFSVVVDIDSRSRAHLIRETGELCSNEYTIYFCLLYTKTQHQTPAAATAQPVQRENETMDDYAVFIWCMSTWLAGRTSQVVVRCALRSA